MKALLTATLLAATPASACDIDTAMAVLVAYKANDNVQRAVDAVVCHRGKKPNLSRLEQASYSAVMQALILAYRESDGSDSAVETVENNFCYAMGER